MTESMSVLTDPATYGVLNSELTTCPRTAVLGELAAQWQQMTGTLQRAWLGYVDPKHEFGELTQRITNAPSDGGVDSRSPC